MSEARTRGMCSEDIERRLLVIKDDGLYDRQGLVMHLVEAPERVISNYFL